MYRKMRVLHRWIGLVNAAFLMLMAITGFVLAIKKQNPSIQPETSKGTPIEAASQLALPSKIAEGAFSAGDPHIKSLDDVHRFELHVSKGIYKVTSKEGYREVQVDATTGEVLSQGQRNDIFFEQIHDMSFFGEGWHGYVLPAVAVSLFLLGFSGVIMFFVPIYRRWKFNAKGAPTAAK